VGIGNFRQVNCFGIRPILMFDCAHFTEDVQLYDASIGVAGSQIERASAAIRFSSFS